MSRIYRMAWAAGIVGLQSRSAYARTDPLTNISFSETYELPDKRYALHKVKPHSMSAK